MPKNYLEVEKETQKRYYIVIDGADRVNLHSANKTASDTVKQQLETIAVIRRSSNVSLILIAQDWNGIWWNFNTLRNQSV